MIVAGRRRNNGLIEVDGVFTQETETFNLNGSEIPQPLAPSFGKDVKLIFNPETQTLSYEYIDRELTEMEQLKADNEMLKLLVADLGLMVGGGL